MRNPLRALFDNRSYADIPDSALGMLIQSFLKGHESSAGMPVNESTAMAVGAVNACVTLISQTVATLPLFIFERQADGGKKRAVDHPLNRIFTKPNGWQTRAEFIAMLCAHVLLRGNAYAYINWVEIKGRQQVFELIPLHPDRIEVKVRDDDSIVYLLHPRSGRVGSPMVIEAEDMLHIKSLSTDGILGRSKLADMREILGITIAANRYAAKFWVNDATPGVVLKHPGRLSDKAYERLKNTFSATNAGAENARRTAILEEGTQIDRIGLSASDSQFIETRKFQRWEIAGNFFVPPHMIGDTEKSTSWGTGIEQQQIAFLQFAIRPLLVAFEQRINRDLVIADQTYFAEFNVDGILRGDINSRYRAYAIGRMWGWLSVNDVRGYENLNPIEGGGVYLQPTNMVDAEMAAALLSPPADGATR